MLYTKNELEREKSRIKYFKILPSMIINENGDGTTLRKYPYKPGMIIELRPGEIERKLLPVKNGMYYDSLKIFFRNLQLWNYKKTFDFSEWIRMQQPFTFEESGKSELQYESGDRILVGNWIKSKMLQLFVQRRTPWNNMVEIIKNCSTLMALIKSGVVRTIKNSNNNVSKFPYSEDQIIEHILKKFCFGESEDKEIYPFLYCENIFARAKIFSGTQELYKASFKEGLIIPYQKGETWDITESRELLLGMIDQAFYELLVLHSAEIQAPEKDRMFEDEFRNRIKILRAPDRHIDKIYYQALDDDIATDKILELQRQGYHISFDEYDSNSRYPNGHIRYFTYSFSRYANSEDVQKQMESIEPYAEQLTNVEAKKAFPEDFYFGRAYYQVKERY